jgi:hypothetical protein
VDRALAARVHGVAAQIRGRRDRVASTGLSMAPAERENALTRRRLSSTTTTSRACRYIWHRYGVIKVKRTLPLFFGVGGRIEFRDAADDRAGSASRSGSTTLSGAPFDVRAAPVLDVALTRISTSRRSAGASGSDLLAAPGQSTPA